MSLRSLVLLLWLVPMSAWAAKMPGIRLYQQGEYVRASRSLKAEIKNPRRSSEDKARARVYLAASLLALGKNNEARQQLEELARTTSEPQVDPATFPSALVEMEKQVRGKLLGERPPVEPDQAERDRLAALEADRLRREQEEAERLRREREALVNKPPVVEQRPVEQEPQGPASEDESPSTFRLRTEASSFLDVTKQRSWGLGVGLTVGKGMAEASLRGLIADPKWGLQLDAGLVFGSGFFRPRVAVRGTAAMGLQEGTALGVGGVVGARLALSPRLTALADLGFERVVSAPPHYKQWLFMASAGIGFNVL